MAVRQVLATATALAALATTGVAATGGWGIAAASDGATADRVVPEVLVGDI